MRNRNKIKNKYYEINNLFFIDKQKVTIMKTLLSIYKIKIVVFNLKKKK